MLTHGHHLKTVGGAIGMVLFGGARLMGDLPAPAAARSPERRYRRNGYFWTGTWPDGTINWDPIPLDCQTWAVLAFADGVRSRELLSWSEMPFGMFRRDFRKQRDLIWSLPAGGDRA